ncbi:MAG: tetratricopeptide repeat protein [Terriglobales bacterium]
MRTRFLCFVLLFLSVSLVSEAQASKQNGNLLLLQGAAQAITAGKLDKAENELQSVLHSAPGEYHALDLLGVIRVLQRREGEAEDLFRQAIQKKSDFAPAHAHLGLLYVQMGRPDEAVPELREVLRINPDRTDASGALVHILREQSQTAEAAGNSEKALGFLIEARKYEPDNPDVQFEFGMMALHMSLPQDAIKAFQRALQLRENDPTAIYNLGRAYGDLARFDDARLQFAHYIKLRPDDPSGYCALGMTLAALERLEEARVQFERSIAVAPAQTEAYFRLGLLELELKDYDSASKNLHQVLDREPKHSGALTALGKIAFDQKRYTEAAHLLQQAIAYNDSMREAHYYLGLTFAREGRKQDSDEQLQIALRQEHDEVEHRKTLFRTLGPAALDVQGSQHQK